MTGGTIKVTELTVTQWLNLGLALGLMVVIFLAVAVIARSIILRRTHRRQAEIQSRLTQMSHNLSTSQEQLAEIKENAAAYPKTDPLPYGELAVDLHQIITLITREEVTSRTSLELLTKAEAPSPTNFWVWLVADFWQTPRFWVQQGQTCTELSAQIAALQKHLKDALALWQALVDMPHTVDREIMELKKASERCLNIGRALHQSGVHGARLNAAMAQAECLARDIQKLPDLLAYESAHRPLEQRKQEVIWTWQAEQTLIRPIERCRQEFETWQATYQTIEQRMKVMRETLEVLVDQREQVPASVNIEDPLQVVLPQLEMFKKLEKGFPALTLDLFTDFNTRAGEVTAVFNAIIQQFEQIQKQWQTLSQLLPAVATLLDQTETQMAAARQEARYGTVWGRYDNDYSNLRHTQRTIGALNIERTPKQLAQAVTQAQLLKRKVENLITEVEAACQARQELIPLLNHEDMRSPPTWFTEANALHKKVEPYHFDNWPSSLSTEKIGKMANSLIKRQQSLLPSGPPTYLAADQVKTLLPNVRSLLADITAFKTSNQQITQLLAAVEKMEQSSLDQLHETHQVLAHLLQQFKETEWPLPPKLSKEWTSLEKLQTRNRKLENNLQKKHVSSVAGKARQVEKWLGACHKTLQPWPNWLQSEIKTVELEFRNQVATLPTEALRNREEIRQLLLIERPDTLPAPARKNSELEKVLYFANQMKTQLQDREDLCVALSQVQAHLTQLEQGHEALG